MSAGGPTYHGAMKLRVLCVVMIVVGCGSEPTKPAAPAAKAASQRFRLPEGVLAVLDVDIPRLRASALWYLARQVMERESTLASVCPEVIESAHGVTVALRMMEEVGDHPPPSARFAIVHGADAARARACLTRAVPDAVRWAATSPGAPVVAKDRPPECQRYDEAVHELFTCEDVPVSVAADVKAAQALLAASHGDDAARACGQALATVERANARRNALGVDCLAGRERKRTLANRAAWGDELGSTWVDDRTFMTAGELVYLADDRTLIEIRAMGGADRETLQGELRAMLAGASQPRWYDTDRAALRGDQAAWFALDAEQLAEHDRDDQRPHGVHKPRRITGSVALHGGARLDLRLHDMHYDKDWEFVTEVAGRLLDDPSVQAADPVQVQASCVGPAPTGPRARRCSKLFDHIAALKPTASPAPAAPAAAGEPGGAAVVAAALAGLRDAVGSCMVMPDAFLACAEQASTLAAIGRCYETLSAWDQPVCGSRTAAIQIDVPLMLIESLKIAALPDRQSTRDCRGPGTGEPLAISLDVDREHPDQLIANVCLGGAAGCWSVDVTDHAVAEPDARWSQGPSFERPPQSRDVPFTVRVTGRPGAQVIETWDAAGKRRLARFPARTTAAQPCASVQALDDTLLVTPGACFDETLHTRPPPVGLAERLASARTAYLVTLHGKRIAAVGDPATVMIVTPTKIANHRWAFATQTGDAVVIQDVATGELVQRIATGAPVEPGMVALTGDVNGHLVLVYGGATARAHTLTIVDVARGSLTSFTAPPECSAPAPGGP